jgi:hypothetical protein
MLELAVSNAPERASVDSEAILKSDQSYYDKIVQRVASGATVYEDECLAAHGDMNRDEFDCLLL